MKNIHQGRTIVTCLLVIIKHHAVAASRPLFHFGVTDFSRVVETTAYIDKSLLIRDVLRYKAVLVTTPRFFAKSTNMDMLKRFFEIEVDDRGDPKSHGHVSRKTITDTDNYRLFVANKLEITRHPQIMWKHFGKYPVIHMDLKCNETISSYDHAVDFYRNALHESYKRHSYLTKSDRLSEAERLECETWCDGLTYRNRTVDESAAGLRTLSEYLFKHYDRTKCFVLIDEYDNSIVRASTRVFDKTELRRIIRLTVGVVSAVIRDNDVYVDRCVITGVSYVAGVYLSSVPGVAVCRFLETHPFANYFGVTLPEVYALLEKPEFNFNKTSVTNVSLSGYVSKWGKKIYSFSTVLQLLYTLLADNYVSPGEYFVS